LKDLSGAAVATVKATQEVRKTNKHE